MEEMHSTIAFITTTVFSLKKTKKWGDIGGTEVFVPTGKPREPGNDEHADFSLQQKRHVYLSSTQKEWM